MNNNPFQSTGLSSSEPAKTSKFKMYIDIAQYFVLFLAFAVVLYLFLIIPTQVKGQSMEPNFHTNDILFSNKLIQIIGGENGIITDYDYQRGDVVVFKREDEPDLIKRIIAVSGETVMIENGRVYVNGVLLEESYIDPVVKPTAGGTFIRDGETKTVPDNQFFALGDNRVNSIDSRSAEVGFIKRDQLRGGPFLQIFPQISLIQRPEYNID